MLFAGGASSFSFFFHFTLNYIIYFKHSPEDVRKITLLHRIAIHEHLTTLKINYGQDRVGLYITLFIIYEFLII